MLKKWIKRQKNIKHRLKICINFCWSFWINYRAKNGRIQIRVLKSADSYRWKTRIRIACLLCTTKRLITRDWILHCTLLNLDVREALPTQTGVWAAQRESSLQCGVCIYSSGSCLIFLLFITFYVLCSNFSTSWILKKPTESQVYFRTPTFGMKCH